MLSTAQMIEESQQRHTRLPYLPGLDGLRGIAVIAVLLFHAGLDLRGGFLGVESFFVLSGFLITGLLLAEWRDHGRIDLIAFWLRRARRLLPALLLVLASTLLYSAVFLPRELAEVRTHALAALLYVLNWQLVWSDQPYFDPTVRPPLLQHLWSLAVEEQFYLLWPPLFVLVMRRLRARGLLLLTLAGAAAGLALMALGFQPGADPGRIYYGTDTRAAGMLLGAALAVVWRPWQPPAASRRGVGLALDVGGLFALALLIGAYRQVTSQHPLLYPGGFILVELSTLLVIMAATHPHARLAPRLLALAPLRWIGVRSYGIYLWHWPIFQVTRPYLDVPLEGWALLGLRLALVAGVAALSYRWVEQPVRQGALARAWQRRRNWVGAGSTLRQGRWPGRDWLHVPLLGVLVLGGFLWFTMIGTPHPVVGDARPPQTPDTMAEQVSSATATAPAMSTSLPTAEAAPSPTASLAGNQVMAAPTQGTPTAAVRAGLRPDESVSPDELMQRSVTPTPGISPIPTAAAPLDAALTGKLQQLLDQSVADGYIPGIVLSVSVPGYDPWNAASGVADLQRGVPIEPNTLVHLGSVSKMFTAAVVLQLAGEHKIDLDAPIDTYLPGVVRSAPSTTVRHLLSHTSGLYDYLEDPWFIVEAFEDPERVYLPTELVTMADRVGTVFRPGTPGAWKYSNTNYVILGMLVEQVTGRTLAEEMRSRIFEPLGLQHTFFAPQEALGGAQAQGYTGTSERVVLSMSFVFATGNIVSTADDLRRFTEALLEGRLLPPEMLDQMTTLVRTGGAFAMPELQYGLGVMRAELSVGPGPDGRARPDEVRAVLGHIGGLAGFRSATWRAPESGIAIALSMNQADIDPNILVRDVFETILTWQGR